MDRLSDNVAASILLSPLTIGVVVDETYRCCSFIKTFDDKPANPDRDAESVQVSLVLCKARECYFRCDIPMFEPHVHRLS